MSGRKRTWQHPQVDLLDYMVQRENAAFDLMRTFARRLDDAKYANDAETVHWLHKRLLAIERDWRKRGAE